MIKHSINDNVHASFMDFFRQFPEIFLGSHTGIDIIIVHNIIFMIFSRRKNRIQIKTVKTEIFNIIQILQNTVYRTAAFGTIFLPIGSGYLIFQIADRAIIVRETVRENIINNCV